jgi:hypothetical protein
LATSLLGAAIFTAMTGIAVERNSWRALGQNISIRATHGDASYAGGTHEFFFKIINENAARVRVQVEITKVDDDGRVSNETESFDARAGAEAGDGGNSTIARDILSYRIRRIQYIP